MNNNFPNKNFTNSILLPPPPPYAPNAPPLPFFNPLFNQPQPYPHTLLPPPPSSITMAMATTHQPPLESLNMALGQTESFVFFQNSSVGLTSRMIMVQLRNESGQSLLSIQHTPSQTFGGHNHHHHHHGVGSMRLRIGSMTNFTDPSGRIVMVAAEGHGNSTTTTVSSGDFAVGFMEAPSCNCGLCPGGNGNNFEGKNSMGERIIGIQREGTGFKFLDLVQHYEVGKLYRNGNGPTSLYLPSHLDVKLKGLILTMAFTLYMQNFVETMCGAGLIGQGRIVGVIFCFFLFIPIIIFFSVMGAQGAFQHKSSHTFIDDSFGKHGFP